MKVRDGNKPVVEIQKDTTIREVKGGFLGTLDRAFDMIGSTIVVATINSAKWEADTQLRCKVESREFQSKMLTRVIACEEVEIGIRAASSPDAWDRAVDFLGLDLDIPDVEQDTEETTETTTAKSKS